MKRFRAREHVSSILVASVSAAFGVLLLQVTGALAIAMNADEVIAGSSTARLMLGIVAGVFIVIALYVGAIVTTNTFATIIAGRTRTIALYRLLGSSASSERRSVAGEGLVVGVIGAAIGFLAGYGIALALIEGGVALEWLPRLDYAAIDPAVLLPVAMVVLTTWAASWVGARRVLVVTPMQAIGHATEMSHEETRSRRGRTVASAVLVVLGVALLALGVAVGLLTPFGVLIGVLGGILSFTGIVIGADRVMPPVLRAVGRVMGTSATSRLAAENAMRYPERSSRMTIGLVIAVTLVTMFAVVAQSYQTMMVAAAETQSGLLSPEELRAIEDAVTMTVAVFSVLIGFSALIAAIGMVNSLSLNVVQRRRELGLLRALGFTARQVRGMIRAESAQLVVAATVVGVALGVVYGWAGAQSLLGSMAGVGLMLPSVPWAVLGAIVVLGGVLALLAALAPARRATRVSPVAALAID